MPRGRSSIGGRLGKPPLRNPRLRRRSGSFAKHWTLLGLLPDTEVARGAGTRRPNRIGRSADGRNIGLRCASRPGRPTTERASFANGSAGPSGSFPSCLENGRFTSTEVRCGPHPNWPRKRFARRSINARGGLTIAHRLVGVAALWSGRPEVASLSSSDRPCGHATPCVIGMRLSSMPGTSESRLWAAVQSPCGSSAIRSRRWRARGRRWRWHMVCRTRPPWLMPSAIACLLHELLGDHECRRGHVETLRSLCVDQRLHFPYWVATGAIFRGMDRVAEGQLDEGLALIVDALREYQARGHATF